MAELLKIALIGSGRVAMHHCSMVDQLTEAKIVAISDLREDRGVPLADKYGIPYFDNYHNMLSEVSDINIVTIATPSGMHFEHAKDIIGIYNKNIVVEKPTFMRLDQIREIYKLAEENSCKIFPVFQNRYNKAVEFVRQAIKTQELGEIRMASARVRWCRPQRYYDRDPWRGTWSHDGGALTNQGVHYLDILRYLGGEIQRVNAITATQGVDVEVEDTGVAIFEFNAGGLGVIEITTAARPDDFEASISIVGSKGLAVISGKATNELITYSPDPSKCQTHSENFEIVYGFGHREMYRDISGVINNRKNLPVSFEDAMRTLTLLHGIYRSAELGTWVDLSENIQSDRLGRPDKDLSALYLTPEPKV